MIIVMKPHAAKTEVEKIIGELSSKGLQPVPLYGVERTVIAVIGEERDINVNHLESFASVDKVMRVLKPYKLVSRETKSENTIIEVNGVRIGDEKVVAMMAGPCSVESMEQMQDVAPKLKAMGINLLRGGAYKPRTGPYSFQGLGKEGLEILSKVGKEHGLATITEIMDPRDLAIICQHADIIQVGARNMQNFELLKELGKTQKPILLKRGLAATIEEFLLAAEYIMVNGNQNVILCERGIRTFETDTRNTLPLATVPIVKELSHLPIIVDPSHAVGIRRLIEPMTKAAIAAGADGIIIEVHPNPEVAKSDAQQQLTPEDFKKLLDKVRPIADAVGKHF